MDSALSSPQKEPFDWYGDDEGGETHTNEPMQGNTSYAPKCYTRLPKWVRELIFVFTVSVVLFAPGIVDYIIHTTTTVEGGEKTIFEVKSTTIGGAPLFLWSFFVGVAFLVYNACRLFFTVVPLFLLSIHKITHGRISTRMTLYMDYVDELHSNLSLSLFLIVALVSWITLFPVTDSSLSWRNTVTNALASILMTSIFFLMEKLFVQIIAVRFHRTVYQDRIHDTKIASEIVKQLNRVARKIFKERLSPYQHQHKKKTTALAATPKSKLLLPFVRNKHNHDVMKSNSMGSLGSNPRLTSQGVSQASLFSTKTSHSLDEFSSLMQNTLPSSEPSKKSKKAKKTYVTVEMVDETPSLNKTDTVLSMDAAVPPISAVSSATGQFHRRTLSNETTATTTTIDTMPNSPTMSRQGSPTKDREESSRRNSDGNHSVVSSEDKQQRKGFHKLASEIANGLNIDSPKEAKKIAKRIFEALLIENLHVEVSMIQDVNERRTMEMRLQAVEKMYFYMPEKAHDALTTVAGRDTLTIDDFSPYYNTTAEAERAFLLFDKDNNGSLTRQELKETVVGLLKERKALSSSLRDVGSAVGKLDKMLMALVIVVCALLTLVIFGVALGPFLVTSTSTIVAMTFIIGNSAKNVFEGLIFLFVTHPFDVGDRVFIDSQNLVVKELGLLTTVFQRWDGQLIYSPNAVLATKQIINIRRSPNQLEVIEIHVAFSTPPEVLDLLRQKLNDWLQVESREFVPRMEIQPFDIENVNKLKIMLFLEHKSNWQDSGKRWTRRNRFMTFLKGTLIELGITYSPPTLNVDVENFSNFTQKTNFQ